MEKEEIFFAFSASLRVLDAADRHAEIEQITGIEPSHSHLKGELANKRSGRRWPGDIWSLSSPLNKEIALSEHLRWLWDRLKPHKTYLRSLVDAGVQIDVFCGYRSNCDHCGFEIDPDAVEITQMLGIRLEISVIIHERH